jgi:hypothetical protein
MSAVKDRRQLLASDPCARYYGSGWREHLTDRERKLLVALAKMVDQYLDSYGDEVDSRSMSAGEHAIGALADYGLMENINTRFGRWTEAGKTFLAEAQSLRS